MALKLWKLRLILHKSKTDLQPKSQLQAAKQDKIRLDGVQVWAAQTAGKFVIVIVDTKASCIGQAHKEQGKLSKNNATQILQLLNKYKVQ